MPERAPEVPWFVSGAESCPLESLVNSTRRDGYTLPPDSTANMGERSVLVVGETASLGRAVVDLLESANIPTRLALDARADPPLSTFSERFPVVIAACNEYFCATARRWIQGELSKTQLVVVGGRDPLLRSVHGVHLVPLPLLPGPFLMLITTLLSGVEPMSVPDSTSGGSAPARSARTIVTYF